MTATAPSPAQPDTAPADTAPVVPARVLVALDASDHANHALAEAARLAASAGGTITGIHAYAAKLHDRRFRQMEGGLPERYREEPELERQRTVHDSLITRGLGVISDSYHDAAVPVCEAAGVGYRRLSPEGKNYRRLVEATESGDFDLLVMGSVGLGAVPGGALGTVCERVVRRTAIDVLVIRDPHRRLGDGPIVAALDGSPRSFGALVTALDVGRRVGAPVHAVAAFDPYFHYVAFHRIAGVLSKEAGQEFRFRDQEKLHEEIIDSGIARIYRSHLEIARTVAAERGVDLVCELLEGKPYRAIAGYLERVGASLLVAGKTGVHADPGLDIGGHAENLLRTAPCHVWLGRASYAPPLDTIARETVTWSREAEDKLAHVPETARAMVRIEVLRLAQESGHTVVTGALIDEATRRFCPARGGATPEPAAEVPWSAEARALVAGLGDPATAVSVRLQAEKRARRAGAGRIAAEHVRPFLEASEAAWSAAALARLARVPEMVRAAVRRRIEDHAREAGIAEITLDLAEAVIAESRAAMAEAMAAGGHPRRERPE